MQKQQLLELRGKIVKRAQAIVLDGTGSTEERFQVLMNIIRSGDADFDILTKTYELAETIENDDAKLSALLDILFEIDAQLSGDEEGAALAQAAEEAPSTEDELTK